MPDYELVTSPLALPSPHWISEDDNLVLRVWNSAAGVRLGVSLRLLDCDGRITQEFQSVTPTSDRAQNSSVFRLRQGALLTAAVVLLAGTPSRGQCYAQLGLTRGGVITEGNFEFVLSTGYVTVSDTVRWPGGQRQFPSEGPGALLSVAGADPAAGSQIVTTVPTGARWRLRHWTATLVTSAVVANRNAYVRITDGANVLALWFFNITQTAGQTRTYWLGPSTPNTQSFANDVWSPIPPDVQLAAGWVISTVVTGMDAGDDWGAPRLTVEEWIDPLT
jgi:hypothetical protein